ncbi:hypothetical protein STAS_22762 [Striga asiatica]|uniref:Uncharacterized protein n=1 Tax=Striga asiatica TaxID=4170 RepID=A0A5A7QLB0_STRAF|nr:hypothetical protein STAS_22762 [Striga asiatica]
MAPPASISLLGPPEIYPATPAPSANATAPTTAAARSYLDGLVANLKGVAVGRNQNPPMGLTENFSPTFFSTGNPCLDFFFHVVPDTPPETLTEHLKLAWKQDPLKALKLVCNLRGVRGTGKSDREGGYTAALWLHKNHPKTLARNIDSLASFGYFKDLLEILFRVLEGPDARKQAKEAHEQCKQRKQMKEAIKLNRKDREHMKEKKRKYGGVKRSNKSKKAKTEPIEPIFSREEKRILCAKRVVERFNRDPDFKFLHNGVSDCFARFLRSDMEMLNSGHLNKISLAAKWCPSIDSSYDRITLLCETISKKVFPRAEYPEYEGVEEAHYAYRVRDRLRKEVLVPLRKALELPEVYIGANDWRSLPYNRVASVAMKTYTGLFLKHDESRFREYLDKVERGEAKIAAGALLPHEIISGLDDDRQVAELQWRRMVDDMAKIGKLNNCLAVCDVSGSMDGLPLEVSVALGLLVSELSEEPWKGKVITFSERPKLLTVKGSSLKKKTRFVSRMEWGGNTNFQKVFDLLLKVAVDGKLKPDQMIKRLFVFSDMEFDEASMNPWETDYKAIVRKFGEKGYGECVPEIVFWNLRDSRATPVPANQSGVALVSGFSKNLMKLFLEGGGVIDPVVVMEAAIAGEEYQKLVVVD